MTDPVWNKVRLIPWIECNAPDQVEIAASVIEAWKPYCRRIIITTTSRNVRFYDQLNLGLPIIPGLKLNPMGRLDDGAMWDALTPQVHEALRMTGSNQFVWEGEACALNSYSLPDLNWRKFSKCAADLYPVEHLWHPSLNWGREQGKRAYYRNISRTVCGARLDTVRFIDTSYPVLPGTWVTSERGFLETVAVVKPIPMLYVNDLPGYWPFEEIRRALKVSGYAKETIIYPSLLRGVMAAEEIGKVLWPTI